MPDNALFNLDNYHYIDIYYHHSDSQIMIEKGMVNEQLLEKFKALYLKKYGISLSDQEATEQATAFLTLMKTLLQKSPETNPEV